MSTSRTPFRRSAAACLAALLLSIAACGGREEAPDSTGAAGEGGDAAATGTTGPGTLRVESERVRPGEMLVVGYTLAGAPGEGAWIGLVPASVSSTTEADNDAADVQYAYVPQGSTSGRVELPAPAPGDYRVRLFSGEGGEAPMLAETAVVTVAGWSWPEGEGPSIQPAADEVAAGEELAVTVTLPEPLPDSAWLGVVPATVASLDESTNDAEDVTYEYVRGGGELRLAIPEPGTYVLRLFPCDDAPCAAVAQAGPIIVD